jgi:hypothetical protein
MCFTGGFALGMMIDDIMLAPVLSQPSLPFPVSPARRRPSASATTTSPRVKARAQRGACVMGSASRRTSQVPSDRFETLRRELGDAFSPSRSTHPKAMPHEIPAWRALGAH